MWIYYVSIMMAIVSNVFYFIIQKSTPHNVNPMVSLAVTYFTAMLTCIVILPFYPNEDTLVGSLKKLNWTSISLGIAIVGLELGFLLAFRAGWNINIAGISANIAVALILIPIGILVFKEHLKPINVLGILICIIGLVLINKK